MTSGSKFYNRLLWDIPCKALYHPDGSCWDCASGNFRKIFPICAKFYTPMVLAQFVRSLNNLDAKTMREFVETVFLLTFSTYMGSAVGQSLVCVFHHIFGRFPHYSLLCFFPAMIGNMWGLIMPPKINNYITNGLCMMIVEGYLRNDDNRIFVTLAQSPIVRTILFMAMSVVIMDSQSILKSDVFWFIKLNVTKSAEEPAHKLHLPSPVFDSVLPTPEQICDHSHSCDMHVYKGAVSNFKIGLSIEVVRALISNMGTIKKSPGQIFNVLANMKTGFVLFLVGYTTIYRTTLCTLNRLNKKQTRDSQNLAALSAGSAFLMYSNFTILAHAIISTIKMMWYRYIRATKSASLEPSSEGKTFKQKLGEYLDQLPLGKFFYVFSIGYVFHMRTFYPWMCPNILMKAVHYTSGMNADPAMLRFSDYLLGYKTSAQ